VVSIAHLNAKHSIGFYPFEKINSEENKQSMIQDLLNLYYDS